MCSLVGVRRVEPVGDGLCYELPSGISLNVHFAQTGEQPAPKPTFFLPTFLLPPSPLRHFFCSSLSRAEFHNLPRSPPDRFLGLIFNPHPRSSARTPP